MPLTTYKIYDGEFNSSIASRSDDQYSDIDVNTFRHYVTTNKCDVVHDMSHLIYCIYPSTNINRSYLHCISWAYPVNDYKDYMVTNQYCIDCEFCFDCISCESCTHCKLCKQCIKCQHCVDCENSKYCELCTKCDDSLNCHSCRNSVNCMSCNSIKNCSFCANAMSSKSCINSFNCFQCDSCKNIKHDIKHKNNYTIIGY